jgi:hypothetical protein
VPGRLKIFFCVMTGEGHSLLVNFWYAHPVGHAVEALRYCLGYHRADPSLRISLLLNGATAVELADLCPFVERTYPVAFTGFHDGSSDPAPALRAVPRDWDYVVDDHRGHEPQQLATFAGLRRFYEASAAHFRARLFHGTAGSEPPPYEPHQQLRFELPAGVRARADKELARGSRWVAVMPAGGTDGRYAAPSLSSWELILRELRVSLGASFCFVGKLRRDERSSTSFERWELERLLGSFPGSVNAFDTPLVEQLALVEACALFLSPHTGFGMAALAVATPWLTISGGRWPEYFFNGVPFHAVLPDADRDGWYSLHEAPPVLPSDEDAAGPRTSSMTVGRIRRDLPELVEAAEVLASHRLSYENALQSHFSRMFERSRGHAPWLWSIDGIHRQYA